MPSYTSSNAMRSGLDAQVGFMNELTHRTYDSVRKLSELNMNFVQQLIQDSVDASRQMMKCTDPLQMAAASASAVQPVAEHLQRYQQQLTGLLTSGQVELMSKAEQGMQQATRSGYSAAQDMAQSMAQASDSMTRPGRSDERGASDSHGGDGSRAPH